MAIATTQKVVTIGVHNRPTRTQGGRVRGESREANFIMCVCVIPINHSPSLRALYWVFRMILDLTKGSYTKEEGMQLSSVIDTKNSNIFN